MKQNNRKLRQINSEAYPYLHAKESFQIEHYKNNKPVSKQYPLNLLNAKSVTDVNIVVVAQHFSRMQFLSFKLLAPVNNVKCWFNSGVETHRTHTKDIFQFMIFNIYKCIHNLHTNE